MSNLFDRMFHSQYQLHYYLEYLQQMMKRIKRMEGKGRMERINIVEYRSCHIEVHHVIHKIKTLLATKNINNKEIHTIVTCCCFTNATLTGVC
jgi:hypothetical protein